MIDFVRSLISSSKNGDGDFFEPSRQTLFDQSFKEFFNVNYTQRNGFYTDKREKEINDHLNNLKNYYFKIEEGHKTTNSKLSYNRIEIPQSKRIFDNLRIAVANTKVHTLNIEKSLFGKPNTDIDRRREFINLLNDAEKVKSDILILPEVSTPYRWLPILADQARRKQRTIIVGLEHIRIGNICYNFLATLLPMEHNGIKDVVVNLRLKNHYSPHEIKTIIDKGKRVPNVKNAFYNLFVWGGIHFSNYNCYRIGRY